MSSGGSPITTHILDTALGRPARGVAITLEIERDGAFHELGRGATDDDGRLRTLLPPGAAAAATYRLGFDTGGYFRSLGQRPFYPSVQVLFTLDDPTQHYHVPLLLAPYGYSTYRGS